MSRFKSYDKISEASSAWKLDETDWRKLRRLPWCVTEKIHGANFCIVVSEDAEVRFAKRKSLLAPDEDFFGHRAVLESLRPAIVRLATWVRERHSHASEVLVYGELFGGAYAHPEVPKIPGMKPVQTGIFYAPDVRFCCFDLAVFEESKRRWIDFEETLQGCAACGLMCVEPLFVGGYTEAVAWPARMETAIPARLGLPLIEANWAEGVVIKPMRTVLIDTSKGRVRPVLKKKIPEFAEDQRYHQAQSSQPSRGADVKDYALDLLEWELLARVNPARVASALSKVGRSAGVRALHEEMIDDIWDEVADRFPKERIALTAEELALLRSVLADEVVRQCTSLEEPS